MNTPNLALPFLEANQNQKYITVNDAFLELDAIVQARVQDIVLATPPVTPADGQVWIVAGSPTGAWVGHTSHLAAWQDGAWNFYVPKIGWTVLNVASNLFLVWTGSAWVGTGIGGTGGGFFIQPLTVSLNAYALQAPQTGTVIREANADGVVTRHEIDSYGAAGMFSAVRADGTALAPTALQADDQIVGFNGFGYAGATDGFAGAASFKIFASQNWATGAHGSYAKISVVPNGAVAQVDAVRIEASGGLTIPPSVVGGDKGLGTSNTTKIYQAGVLLATLLRGYLAGFILSNNVGTPNTKIDYTLGSGVDSTNSGWISGAGGTIDFGVVGANGLDAGTIASGTWYAIHAIGKLDGTVAGLASVASTGFAAPTLPSGYTLFRCIGFAKTDGSSHLLAFVQVEDVIWWGLDTLDYNSSTTGGTLVAVNVPPTVKVRPLLRCQVTSSVTVIFSSPDEADVVPTSFTTAPGNDVQLSTVSARPFLTTNTSQQIRVHPASTASINIDCRGWVWSRGRLT